MLTQNFSCCWAPHFLIIQSWLRENNSWLGQIKWPNHRFEFSFFCAHVFFLTLTQRRQAQHLVETENDIQEFWKFLIRTLLLCWCQILSWCFWSSWSGSFWLSLDDKIILDWDKIIDWIICLSCSSDHIVFIQRMSSKYDWFDFCPGCYSYAPITPHVFQPAAVQEEDERRR